MIVVWPKVVVKISEKWMHAEYVLKVEWIGFPMDQLKREKLEG